MNEGNGGDVVVVPGRFDRSPTLGALAAAFVRARVKFPTIGKDREAEVFSQRTGKSFKYSYADLAACLDVIVPPLAAEGLALFQPPWVEGGYAVVKTLLVHAESGEWMSTDFAVAIVDPSDARSIGSASAYACRYGLKLVVPSIAEEDDDGEAARGGQHEMAKSKTEPACPGCGVIGSVIKGRADMGGGWLCWPKRQGCGLRWPDGPFPTAAPPIDPEPPAGHARAKKATKPPAAAPRDQAATTQTVRAPADTAAGSPAAGSTTVGSEDCPVVGCWGPRGHEGDHVFEGRGSEQSGAGASAAADRRGADVQVGAAAAETPASPAPVTRFKIGNAEIETAGMTESQFRDSVILSTEIDKGPLGRGYARGILGKILGKPAEQSTRKELTFEKAEKYLLALRQAAAAEVAEPGA